MKKKMLYAAIGALFPLAIWGHLSLERASSPPMPPGEPKRIVSLAPSISETLYAIGLGDSVAGVTRFCAYPPEVQEKPKVAGFSDINYEAVLRLRPDLVVMPSDNIGAGLEMKKLGLPVMHIDTRTLGGFMRAVLELGESTGHKDDAARVIANMEQSLMAAQANAAGKTPPRVLFAVMHSYEGAGHLAELYAIGRDGFYDELIRAAGGQNVYQGDLAFPRLSREAIIFLNPDIIIDVIPTKETDLEAVRQGWQSLASVKAIKNGRLHLLTDEGDTVPGPRSYKTLDKLSRAFHPSESARTP